MEGTVFSLLPPFIAIVLCVLFKRAVWALAAGVLTGALLLYDFQPVTAVARAVDDILWTTLSDRDHIVNLLFTTVIGGVVGILNFSPSSTRLLQHISGFLHNRKKTGIVIWFTGLLFFIDDYANSLIVGNTFRKVADQYRISREKLAYIVDTTSAPIASLALISTWIGFEISVIGDALAAEGIDEYTGYGMFLSSIPYRFYPLLALLFCLLICWMQRDYGAMLRAEHKAIAGTTRQKDSTPAFESNEQKPFHPVEWLIVIPLLVLISVSIAYMFYSGISSGVSLSFSSPLPGIIDILSNSDAFMALLAAALSATLVSFVIHTAFIRESGASVAVYWLKGCQTMLIIDVILILAWSIGDVCTRLETGLYAASWFEAGFDPYFLPLLTFLCAALISFATGTSFGTMSILMPVAVPVVASVGAGDPAVMYGTVGSVLAGAIFGDHCSPLSDTTILSSGASGCEVTAHVNTQLPYALTVALVSALCLLLVPLRMIPAWWLLIVGGVMLWAVIRFWGKPCEEVETTASKE